MSGKQHQCRDHTTNTITRAPSTPCSVSFELLLSWYASPSKQQHIPNTKANMSAHEASLLRRQQPAYQKKMEAGQSWTAPKNRSQPLPFLMPSLWHGPPLTSLVSCKAVWPEDRLADVPTSSQPCLTHTPNTPAQISVPDEERKRHRPTLSDCVFSHGFSKRRIGPLQSKGSRSCRLAMGKTLWSPLGDDSSPEKDVFSCTASSPVSSTTT